MAGDGRSDGELVRAAQQGDDTAWTELVHRHGPGVRAVARMFRLSSADADDVYSITLHRLLSHLDTLRNPDRVGAWLRTIARNESIRILKRNGRQVPTGDDEAFEGPDPMAPPPEYRLIADERQKAVWVAIAKLPPHCQRLLRLFMVDERPSYDEISAALDRPLGSIGPTKRRCLDKMRNLLSGITGDDEGSGDQEDPQ